MSSTLPASSPSSSIVSELSSAMFNSNIFIKFISISLCIGYVLSFSHTVADLLSILPGNILPPNFTFWTIITYSFIESHIWMVACDLAILFLYEKLVSPLWGTLEMLRFYGIISVSVALLTTITYLFVYLVTQNTDILFDNPVNGLAGYIGGFTIVLKQTMPDHILINSPFGKLRNKHVPMCGVFVAIFARFIRIVPGPFPIMFSWGMLVAWVYLRFYQKHDAKTKGDSAEGFSFASFFPDNISPIVSVLSNSVFAILVKLKICHKIQRKFEIEAPTVIAVSLPGMDTHDAERRRQLALKALNERLNRVATLAWPNMDETIEMKNTTQSETDSSEEQILASTHSKMSETSGSVDTIAETTNSPISTSANTKVATDRLLP